MTHPMRCRLRASAGDVTRVDVYDDIGAGGWFSDGLTAKDFTARLAGVRGGLDVHINSPGGDVFDGLAIASAIRDHQGKTTGVVDGLAASIASVILQACDDRVVQPGGMVMVHDPFGTVTGDSGDMATMAQALDKVGGIIAGAYSEKSGKTAEYWRAQMKTERWMDAAEAVSEGLADRVGSGRAQLPAGLDVAAMAIPGTIAARLRTLPRAADAGKCPECNGAGKVDGKPCPCCGGSGSAADCSTGSGGGMADVTEARIRAIAREELAAVFRDAIDSSPWDASRAWHNGAQSDDPAKFYAGICAGEKTAGDPKTQDHWALPYKYTPSSPVNAAAVRDALGRLSQTQDLKDPAGTKALLERLMKQVNPDYEPEDKADGIFADPHALARAFKEEVFK